MQSLIAGNRVRNTVFLLLRLSGIPLLLRLAVQRYFVTILCYHDPSADVFERHIELLRRRYNIVSLQDCLVWQQTHAKTLPRRALVITLDDGHKNNIFLAEALQRYSVPATIFLCSAIVGTRRHFWWTAAPQRDVARLKAMSDGDRVFELRKLGWDEAREYSDRQALSDDEVRQLLTVADIQSHSRFHPILPRCNSARAADEIRNSKAELQFRFGRSIDVFAYPNGDFSKRDIGLVREAGYGCAVTIEGGYNGRGRDPFRLRRLRMSDDAGDHELIVKASGLWALWEWLDRWFQRARISVPAMQGSGSARFNTQGCQRDTR